MIDDTLGSVLRSYVRIQAALSPGMDDSKQGELNVFLKSSWMTGKIFTLDIQLL